MADGSDTLPSMFSFTDLCSMAFNNNQGNCSGLVKDVAKFMGVYLPDKQANDLIDFMTQYWQQVTDDDASDYALRSRLVVAGLMAYPNGHVLVVMPGTTRSGGYRYTDSDGQVKTAAYHGDYPRSCSAALGGWPGAVSNGEHSVYDAWGNRQKYSLVRYWLAPLPGTEVCKAKDLFPASTP